MTKRETPDLTMVRALPQKEHLWLKKLVGEWTYEADATMALGTPPTRFSGTETVRSLGDLWFVAEGVGEMPGGEAGTTLLSLGYDPQKGRYVGTWIGSMMTYLWQYEGSLDAGEKILTLDSVGPSIAKPGATAKFKDVIEFKSDDHRVLTSKMLADDGAWHQVMIATYRRKR